MAYKRKGQGQGRSRLDPEMIQQKKAVSLALELRAIGTKPADILEQLHEMDWGPWSPWTTFGGMYKAMDKAIKDLPTNNAESLRNDIDQVFLGIINRHWDKADNPRHADVVLRANNGRAKLWNLDAYVFEDGGTFSLSFLSPQGYVQNTPANEVPKKENTAETE